MQSCPTFNSDQNCVVITLHVSIVFQDQYKSNFGRWDVNRTLRSMCINEDMLSLVRARHSNTKGRCLLATCLIVPPLEICWLVILLETDCARTLPLHRDKIWSSNLGQQLGVFYMTSRSSWTVRHCSFTGEKTCMIKSYFQLISPHIRSVAHSVWRGQICKLWQKQASLQSCQAETFFLFFSFVIAKFAAGHCRSGALDDVQVLRCHALQLHCRSSL